MPFYAVAAGEERTEPPRPSNLLAQQLTRFVCTSGGDWARISPEAKDLLLQLLDPDPAVRILPRDALQHPWVARRPAAATPAAAAGVPGGSGGAPDDGEAGDRSSAKRARR